VIGGPKFLAIASLALALVQPARAQQTQPWTDAQRLLSDCSGPMDSPRYNSCIDYIEGIKDILNYLSERGAAGVRFPCPPSAITLGQLHDVVVTFIRSNPQYYNIAAAPVVYAALVSAFPCRSR
jgi:hypothetical protein